MTIVVEFKESPTEVTFSLAGSGTSASWSCDAAEQAVLDAIDQTPWGPRPVDAPDAIRQAGALLRAKLAAVVPVGKALVAAFAADPLGSRPLFFRVGSDPSLEAVPFEAVWDDHVGAFAALDTRWPVARLPTDVTEPPGPFTMEPSLQVVAVLAAEGIDPSGQIEALRKACASQPGLTVEVTVLTTRTSTIKRLHKTEPGWTVELVPPTADALITRLRDIQPHLLHIFCHGTADGPRLLVAQRDDLTVLELTVGHFMALAQPAWVAPWLVTLNCCEGAAPGEHTASLASGLVRNGLPAVIGMRKAVDRVVADTFCADLYASVFARLAQIAPRGSAVSSLDWAAVLHEPRRRLSVAHGAPGDAALRQKEWTMPVLYLATTTPRLRGRPTGNLTADQVRTQLAILGTTDGMQASGMSADFADQLRAPVLAVLYP